jgi:G3E family GTPase
VDLIKQMHRRHAPDVLFVEPSEMVVTEEMRQVCAMGRRDVAYDVGPLITVVDGPHFDFLWAERSRLITGQVKGADVVAIGRADEVDAAREADIRATLADVHPDIVRLSSVSGEGVGRLTDLIAEGLRQAD